MSFEVEKGKADSGLVPGETHAKLGPVSHTSNISQSGNWVGPRFYLHGEGQGTVVPLAGPGYCFSFLNDAVESNDRGKTHVRSAQTLTRRNSTCEQTKVVAPKTGFSQKGFQAEDTQRVAGPIERSATPFSPRTIVRAQISVEHTAHHKVRVCSLK